ncbi:HAD-IA family hydrolase [Legionella israelensis]|uniref:HAD-superfamily hydrolase n=1 Tax=Legionella israelensis TaxID=454 RepID=A0A0W0V713_9GAMM|nr:HAD-IA family hydrolase [Legionella israelensis]KTD15921.1 HAD-superfamily hydrolase [Legionella israelensis]QBS09290.1 HAD family hydrolase [Legionella israelensis]SCY21803.1 haloacid dehalogenase superfamily, subfamily IA, variant 3 with third motif having DD or ED [Legionella israelensis DSM 19235]STX60184.1 HAD-superfamily hydrolase [Legionella israelensis]
MSIKLVLFDLDGVLVDSREHHYVALNRALADIDERFVISKREHLQIYDGLSTKRKLQMLTKERGLDTALHEKIWQKKQKFTFQVIDELLKPDPQITALFKQLKADGLKIYVCSNSIRETIKLILLKMELMPYVDYFLSNEDVASAKPHPEMYWTAMIKEKVLPKETLIVEDSYVGRTAALSSGANLCAVKSPAEVCIDKIYSEMNRQIKSLKWHDDSLNVLIPMSGAGSRFVNAGFTFPKPLISIGEKPMVQLVVENLNVQAQFIFIVRRDHYETYNLESMLKIIAPGCKIIITEGVTEGACCSTLLAESYINTEAPLLIANSDQFVEWESGAFFHAMNAPNVDGGILTFENTHPKWSYVRLDEHGNVTILREKEVISNQATVGIYYWSHGKDYVHYAKQMISKNIRVNNEFYVAPVYNEAVADGMKFKAYAVDKMWGLGTPEDLQHFLSNYPFPGKEKHQVKLTETEIPHQIF